MAEEVKRILEGVKKRDPDQPEFYQAVEEVCTTLIPLLEKEPKYIPILERIVEPERVVMFRVAWVDDKGKEHVNRGYRVQFNSAIGPYKGGLRFRDNVNLSIIKFLGFEQIFKNALTTLPMGGGKGGSDFEPKGKSDLEVMRFCQSFMSELFRHIGPNTDVPAGDIGVGGREIGFLFGMYKKIVNRFEGVLTGKGANWGGSLIRPEATGYGAVYFMEKMLAANDMDMKGKKVLVSGAGNVAQYCVEKLLHVGAIPLTVSDTSGCVYEPEGFTHEKLAYVFKIKNEERKPISEYTKYSKEAQFFPKENPWRRFKADIAMPCATQNEVDTEDAKALVANGVKAIGEGANMPSTPGAIAVYFENNVLYGPAKAVNAGGVAVSGLEMSQNSLRLSWTREEVDAKLKKIMGDIFDSCFNAAKTYAKNPKDYMTGANIAGFLKVAEAMLQQGVL
ncbi:nadp-specific glutamate dehydrogenase 1-related [Anaeramoeba ignava]|uniref:Glutamate dehydrogenase n=1 Tax=Anaeramoeba ignava TaxID=1746090 RepID=A0A9Q0LK92_ANAIG|nr:nadp-specific glutamate dehydrogenase 1-related [Anaeramoeba ignava]KAJ5074447.1 nadp-specific glutamate dehydrogenase 1-related [Anaeramoeba ignava]|eukprot:Anaeramoba_ignava/a479046_6440.p1 GENE.a479046_6440~~a479046_6440.p1  ORF type:complete len:448 (+),score=154.08 a479046_6440:118-1461(+)